MLKFLIVGAALIAGTAAQAQVYADPQSREELRRVESNFRIMQENNRLQLELQNRQLRDRLANPESYVAPVPSPGTQCTVIGLGHGDAAVDCN